MHFFFPASAPPDSPAVAQPNSEYGTSSQYGSESGIWAIDPDTGALTAMWTNTDGSEYLDTLSVTKQKEEIADTAMHDSPRPDYLPEN